MIGKKWVAAFLCFVVAMWGAFFYYGDSELGEGRSNSEDSQVGAGSGKSELHPPQAKIDKTSARSEIKEKDGRQAVEPEPAVTSSELHSTRERLGFVDEQDKSVYESYSNSALEAMGEAGDLAALSVLAGRYYESGEPELANSAMEKAAMFGSTEAPLSLGTTLITVAASESAVAGEYDENSREMLLRGFSWLAFGVLRKEPFAEERITDMLRSEGVVLSPEEQELVQRRAIELYKELSSEREARGLQPFDVAHEKVLDSLH